MLENPSGKFYIGSTNNVQQRIRQHNPTPEEYDSSKFTRKNGPWKLVVGCKLSEIGYRKSIPLKVVKARE